VEYTIFEELVHSDWRHRHRQTTSGKSSPTKAPAPKASIGAAQCVDSFEPNSWGLHNVQGNIWEWTEDCWNDSNTGNPGDGRERTGDCPEFERGPSLERRELVIYEPACVPTFATVECVQQRHRCQVCVESHDTPIFSHRTSRPLPIAPILDEAAFHDFSSRPMASSWRVLAEI